MTGAIIGIDEVGRGAWAGPLLVAAVRLHRVVPGLRDSKLLTRLARERLALEIRASADIGFGWIEAPDIDEQGLSTGLSHGCTLALHALAASPDELIIIDGRINIAPPEFARVEARARADQSEPAVSAASIVAKVARDHLMARLALDYPHYGFDQHVGYGTTTHLAALKKYGPCKHHRFSFRPIKMIAAGTS